MEGLVVFMILGTLVPLLLTIRKVFTKTGTRKRLMIILNLVVWCYEMFFFIAVCGGLPHTQVHFGGGLGDLLFLFMLIGLILVHIIMLSIMSYKTSQAALLFIPLAVVAFPLLGMHGTAAWGDKDNDYMTAGNNTGLYYDAAQVRDKRQRQNEFEENSKPKRPEFATVFESELYDAERGGTDAQDRVGCSYATGEGIEKNDTLAVKWFRLSAEGGNVFGGYHLGLCYYNGEGDLTVDYVEAVKWFGKAADMGHDDAQYMLGRCYGLGKGVEQDDEQGYKWLRLAARQDHKQAQELLRANGQTW